MIILFILLVIARPHTFHVAVIFITVRLGFNSIHKSSQLSHIVSLLRVIGEIESDDDCEES